MSDAGQLQGWLMSWRLVVLAAVAAVPLFGFAVVAAGAGHGTLVPMALLFPFGPLTALATGPLHPNDLLGVGAALIQLPAYATALRCAARRGLAIVAGAALFVLHVGAAVVVARSTW
jgi:hypothetical protein